MKVRPMRHARGLTALGAACALVLTACGEASSSNQAGGEGLPAGATKAEYQAAFKDIEPITLKTQSTSPKGSVPGRSYERYYEAVEEWSGGKITWDVSYSNAVADPISSDDALRDGRLDWVSVAPPYEPAEYPAFNALMGGSFITGTSAVEGLMRSNAWLNEVAFESDEIMQEFEDHGMVPLLPFWTSGAQAYFCGEADNTSLDTLDGATIGVDLPTGVKQAEALGTSPISVPYTEFFESLQRGVVDCISAPTAVAVSVGFLPEAPNAVIDPEVAFSMAFGTIAFSKRKWDELPLVAQQLLWDKLDVYISQNIIKSFINVGVMAQTLEDSGGSVQPLEDNARETLRAKNDELLEDLRDTEAVADGDVLVDAMTQANQDWQDKVHGLGYEEVPYNDFHNYLAKTGPEGPDVSPYAELVMSEIFNDLRPS